MSLFEAKIPFLHYVWQESTQRDSHGNKTGQFGIPILRHAVQLYPAAATINRSDMVNPNVVVRTETDIIIDVDDASVFGARDEVDLDGVRFKVQGQPQFSSYDALPIDGYSDLIPEQLHVKRVT